MNLEMKLKVTKMIVRDNYVPSVVMMMMNDISSCPVSS